MTLSEIKSAIESGQTVCWSNESYQVIKDCNGQYLIKCLSNNHCIGLTWADETTLNGKESDFFIAFFDYSTLFNPEPKPVAPVSPEENYLERKYRESKFSKKWAATHAEAVAKTVKEYLDAKKQRDDWASREYAHNNKRVMARAYSEYEQRETSVYDANERRRRNRIRSAEYAMQEAKKDLRDLWLTDLQINELLAL